MGRKPTGAEVVRKARRSVVMAKTTAELRIAQAVLLPLVLGLSLAETAQAVGRSRGWVSIQRRRYIHGEALDNLKKRPSKGGRRNEILRKEDEHSFVMDACVSKADAVSSYEGNSVGIDRKELYSSVAKYLRRAMEKHRTEPVAMSTIYKLMNRVAKEEFANGTASDWESIYQLLR
jgi:hypothetical protein